MPTIKGETTKGEWRTQYSSIILFASIAVVRIFLQAAIIYAASSFTEIKRLPWWIYRPPFVRKWLAYETLKEADFLLTLTKTPVTQLVGFLSLARTTTTYIYLSSFILSGRTGLSINDTGALQISPAFLYIFDKFGLLAATRKSLLWVNLSFEIIAVFVVCYSLQIFFSSQHISTVVIARTLPEADAVENAVETGIEGNAVPHYRDVKFVESINEIRQVALAGDADADAADADAAGDNAESETPIIPRLHKDSRQGQREGQTLRKWSISMNTSKNQFSSMSFIALILLLHPFTILQLSPPSLSALPFFFESFVLASAAIACQFGLFWGWSCCSLSAGLLALVEPSLHPCALAFAVGVAGHAFRQKKHHISQTESNGAILQNYLSALSGIEVFRACTTGLAFCAGVAAVAAGVTMSALEFLPSHYKRGYTENVLLGNAMLLDDGEPGLGIPWYLFWLIFDRARPLYLLIFHLSLMIAVTPIAVRLIRQPLVLLQTVFATYVILKREPILSDAIFGFVMLTADRKVAEKMLKSSLVALSTGIAAAVLYPTMLDMWLQRGAGNPNFVYVAQLAFTIGYSLLVLSFASKAILVRGVDDGRT